MHAQGSSYWKPIAETFISLMSGLRLTLAHFVGARRSRRPVAISDPAYFRQPDGIATIQYPHQTLPVPDTGRYRLHNEIDDCIVCDKCAKICPVNCITIEPVRAISEFGRTSDGTPKRIYAARFDIDMAKCCFCGLCTTVCPTECLTMTKVYDFSVTDIREHNYAFSEMTAEEIAEKKKQLEEYQQSKATAAQQAATNEQKDPAAKPAPAASKPVFKPRIKPPGTPPSIPPAS